MTSTPTTDLASRLTAALADRYTLEKRIGEGGMATVFLAHDLKHDRKVALKVLKPELAAVLGGERFLNEIRVTANLQHPHILALYDSGVADSFLFYVMPFVEGEPLDVRLARERQMGIEDAVALSAEVASALDYAHRHDVIHRDIKPANVLMQDGKALVADFGIALALKAAGGDRLTETGLSLGTPHYMSPEQAAGDRDVDARTDVYALGAMTYEMLAGEPPHTGSSIQAVLSRVLTEEPRPVTEIRHSVPDHVAFAVEKALAKVPADRFSTAAEFATALTDPRSVSGYVRTTARTAPAASGKPWWRHWQTWAIAAGVAVVAGVVGNLLKTEADQRRVARFRIIVEPGQELTTGPVNALALSPDGNSIVYVGRISGSSVQLYHRRLDELVTRPIPGTVGATFPAFSPDGTRLAFFGPGGLSHVSLAGGSATSVPNAQTQVLSQVVWLDGRSFIITATNGGLAEIGLDGGTREIARVDADAGEATLFPMAVLPDRRTVLTIASLGQGVNGRVIAIDIRDGTRTSVIEALTNAVWYSEGHLLWTRPDGTLLAAPFDLATKEITGEPVTLAEGIRQAIGGSSQVAVSATGSMIYLPERPFNLTLVDRRGGSEVISAERRFHSPRFAPDASRIAVDFQHQGSRDVWTLDLDQGTLTRLTFENDGHDPVWTPDGRHIVYVSGQGVLRRSADGSGAADTVFIGDVPTSVLSFVQGDGRAITAPTGTSGSFDIGLLTLDEDSETKLLASPYNEQFGSVSRNGRWLAYSSNETGQDEVYVRPFESSGAKTLVSQDGGTEPVWSADGRELFYFGNLDGVPYLFAASVRTDPDFAVTDRTPLFDVSEFEPSSPHPNYDVSPDGARFVMVHQGALSEIVYVLNWSEEIRRRSEQ